MRKLSLLLIVSIILLVTGIVSAQEETYIVQSGDTIQGIANAYGVDVNAILIRNAIIDPNRITRGQTLIIPTGALTVPISHVVQPGENLRDIATRYNTTVEALVATNQLANPNHLVAGQVITLPAQGGGAAFPRTYRVDVGDTLRKIGERFGVTWQQLAAYNNIPNPNLIYAGMTIHIPPTDYVPAPTPAPQPTPTTHYVVQYGDTLYSIARAFGVSVSSLSNANGIYNPNRIFAGQVLVIPSGGYHPAPQPHPYPQPQPRQTVNGYYWVRYGDTLFAIAHSFGVNIYDIAEANRLLNLNAIYAGQALRIPGR